MATNVTQKDRTLEEVLAYLQQCRNMALMQRFNGAARNSPVAAVFAAGRLDAIDDMVRWVRGQLGYTVGMPLEVSNQSEWCSNE